jgi:hypothetical protein
MSILADNDPAGCHLLPDEFGDKLFIAGDAFHLRSGFPGSGSL